MDDWRVKFPFRSEVTEEKKRQNFVMLRTCTCSISVFIFVLIIKFKWIKNSKIVSQELKSVEDTYLNSFVISRCRHTTHVSH